MIEDFGGVIHGAKKEMSQIRKNGGLKVENASAWDMKRRNETVNRTECFPAPNYRQMYEAGGYSKEACYYIKKVRESLSTSPNFRRISSLIKELEHSEQYKGTAFYTNLENKVNQRIVEIQNCYMRDLEYIQNELFNTKTPEDIKRTMFRLNYFCDRRADKGDISFVTNKTRAAIKIYNTESGRLQFTTEMERSSFLQSSEQKILSNYVIDKFFKDDSNIRFMYDRNSPLKAITIKTSSGEKIFYDETGKRKFFSPSDWQKGTYYVLDKKTGKIVENNFPSKEDAQKYIIDTVKGERVKTSLVPFTTKNLDNPDRTGEDYLQGKNVDGDLMLETFEIYGGQFGEWENQEERQYHLNKSFEAFKDLAAAIGIDDKDISLGGKLGIAWGARGNGAAPSHYEHIYKVINLTKTSGAGFLCKEWAMALNNYAADAFRLKGNYATSKESGNNPFKDVIKTIKYGSTYPQFYKDALLMDKCVSKYSERSWASDEELFSRAFACYVKDKLNPEKSDYLIGQADIGSFEYKGKRIYAYPQGEERKNINAAFDRLIETLKEKGLLHQRDAETTKNLYSEKIDKMVSSFEHLILRDDPDTVNDVLYQIIINVEEFDKNGDIDLSKLYEGSYHLENCTRDNMLSLTKVYIDNLKRTLNECASLNMSSKDINALFNQITGPLDKQSLKKPKIRE